ncbi:MAG: bifunctional hydroxymethylpyrimidine kinase/phosphomethylpyrimidine kinase [Calditrichia bacterium]
MKKALTIAGSDSGGGAGIQADLKTFMAFGVYGMSVLTALTAQNTLGVQGIFEVSPEFVTQQLDSVLSDIGTDAAKTGMLANADIITVVARSIEKYGIDNLVVDPVMVAKSGDPLLAESAREALKTQLLPLARVITPNLFEAETLLSRKITTLEEMKEAAAELKKIGSQWVVIKGGHLNIQEQAIDIAYDGNQMHLLRSQRFSSENTHGTGCTFASAIAAGLAKGREPLPAIQRAKEYITQAIREGLKIGKGYGPTNHLVGVQSYW